MVTAMNRVLKDYIPDITMPFLDDIPIRGCLQDTKDESIDAEGCRKFVVDHIHDCEKVLRKLEDVVGKHVPPDRTGWNMQRTGSSQNRPRSVPTNWRDRDVNMPKSHICINMT